MMTHLPVALVLLFWNGAMLALFFMYRKDMLKSPGAKFVFGISDLWALMLGLSPLLMLVAYLIEIHDYDLLIVALGIGVPHGLAGTYLATLYNSFMQNDTQRSQWLAFFSTAAGALLGTTLFAVVSLLVLVFLPVTIGVFALNWYYRAKRSRVEASDLHSKALNGEKSVKERNRDV